MILDNNWEKVFVTDHPHQADIAREYLAENKGITAVIINKKDRNYDYFGRIELYVPIQDAAIAKTTIDNEISFG
jgi:hypothetical protein